MKKIAFVAASALALTLGACSQKAQDQTAAAANTMATDTVNIADNAADATAAAVANVDDHAAAAANKVEAEAKTAGAKMKAATGEAMTDTGNAIKAAGEDVKR